MTENEFLVCVAKALELELEQISLETIAEDLEAWDSLGHLTILFALDKASGGKASKIDGDLVSPTTVDALALKIE